MIEHIEMLSNAAAQIKYERDVPIACVPDELVCGFTDDLYHPKWQPFIDAFNEAELKSLSELYGMLCIAARAFDRSGDMTIVNIQKSQEWRAVISFAKDLTPELKYRGEQSVPECLLRGK